MFKILFLVFFAIFYISCSNLDINKIRCDNSKDCPSDATCDSGHCVLKADLETCKSNQDCEAPTPICEDGKCVADTPKCTTNADCTDPGKTICDNGVCVANTQECTQNKDCKENIGEFCNKEINKCVSACNEGSGCSSEHHEICKFDNDTQNWLCMCEEGYHPNGLGGGECVKDTPDNCEGVTCGNNEHCDVNNPPECVCNTEYTRRKNGGPCVKKCNNKSDCGIQDGNYCIQVETNKRICSICQVGYHEENNDCVPNNDCKSWNNDQKRCSNDGMTLETCEASNWVTSNCSNCSITEDGYGQCEQEPQTCNETNDNCPSDMHCNFDTNKCEPNQPMGCPPHSNLIDDRAGVRECQCVTGYKPDSEIERVSNDNPCRLDCSNDSNICDDSWQSCNNGLCTPKNGFCDNDSQCNQDKLCDYVLEHKCKSVNEVCQNSGGELFISDTGGGEGHDTNIPECFCGNDKVNTGPRCTDPSNPSPCAANICGPSNIATCREQIGNDNGNNYNHICICKTGYYRQNPDDVTSPCVDNCTPDCSDKQCGNDGCGGTCGTCGTAEPICNNGTCVANIDDCTVDEDCQYNTNYKTSCKSNHCNYECHTSDDCTDENKPICDSTNWTCRACVSNNDCTDNAKPICDTNGKCVAEFRPFITEWSLENGENVKIGIASNYTYSYSIDCDYNGNFTPDNTGQTGSYTCSNNSGQANISYKIAIRGNFPYFRVSNADLDKFRKVIQWGNIHWLSMRSMFYNCPNVTIDSNAGTPDLSEVTDIGFMFYGTNFNGDISNWDVSNVTTMDHMLQNAKDFNQALNNWHVENVTSMNAMFSGAESFNQPLNNWNVSNVYNMNQTFSGAKAFNGDISNWNVSKVTDMSYMFSGASNFNQDLNWDVSKVTRMIAMFKNAKAFNGNISSWTVTNVTKMSHMFNQALAFNGNISNWDVSKVTDMSYMFYYASSFNQDISSWTPTSITNMEHMFQGASSFNQDLSSWHVCDTIPHTDYDKDTGTESAPNYWPGTYKPIKNTYCQ